MTLTAAAIFVVLAAVTGAVLWIRDRFKDGARTATDEAINGALRKAAKSREKIMVHPRPLTKEETRAELKRLRDIGRGD